MSLTDIAGLTVILTFIVAQVLAGAAAFGHLRRSVDAVHNEVRPPSNGTTSGAISETILVLQRWELEELLSIRDQIGGDLHAPPPDVEGSLRATRPPERPVSPMERRKGHRKST